MHLQMHPYHAAGTRTFCVKIGRKISNGPGRAPRVWATADGLAPGQRAEVDRAVAETGTCAVWFFDPFRAVSFLLDLLDRRDADAAVGAGLERVA